MLTEIDGWLARRQTLATFPSMHGYPGSQRSIPHSPKKGREHFPLLPPPQRAQEGQRGQKRATPVGGCSAAPCQPKQSSLAVMSHTHRGEVLAVENPVPQGDEESHQTWVGIGQPLEGHYSHTWKSPDFEPRPPPPHTHTSHTSQHPEGMANPNLTPLPHTPRHLLLLLWTTYTDHTWPRPGAVRLFSWSPPQQFPVPEASGPPTSIHPHPQYNVC